MRQSRYASSQQAKGVIVSSWALLLLLGTSNCQPHDDQPKVPTPCASLPANPLKIKILEYTGTPIQGAAYNDQPLTFVAPGSPYTSYQWSIGPTLQRTSQQFTLAFANNDVGKIPVTLVAQRPPNTACYPHDDGVDTLVTTLDLIPWQRPSPLFGKYRGATRRNPRDTFTVRIYQGPSFDYPTNPAAPPTTYASNIPRGCTTPYREIGLAWNGVQFSLGGCTGFDGSGYLVSQDSIHLAYRAQITPTILDEVFLGKRVK